MNIVELTQYCLRQGYLQDDSLINSMEQAYPTDVLSASVQSAFLTVSEFFLRKRIMDFDVVEDLTDIDFRELDYNFYSDFSTNPIRSTSSGVYWNRILHDGEKLTLVYPGTGVNEANGFGLPLSGDFQIDTLISSFSGSGQAGIEIFGESFRSADDPLAANDFTSLYQFYFDPANGRLTWELNPGSDSPSSGSTPSSSITLPIYLRVSRSGPTMKFMYSTDGVSYTTFYSFPFTPAYKIRDIYSCYLYLANSSSTAVFDYFRITRSSVPYVIRRYPYSVRDVYAVSVNNNFIPKLDRDTVSPFGVDSLQWYFLDGHLHFTQDLNDYVGDTLKLYIATPPTLPGLISDSDADHSIYYLTFLYFMKSLVTSSYASSFWGAVNSGNTGFKASNGQNVRSFARLLDKQKDFFLSIIKASNDRRYVLNQIK